MTGVGTRVRLVGCTGKDWFGDHVLQSAIVFCNPPPAETALSSAELESLLEQAQRSAIAKKISGKALTPFLLAELAKMSGGRTLEANIALLLNNATVAAKVAAEINC